MSVLKVISTTSQRKNFAALACARYNRHTPTVVVLDQGGGQVLDGYVEGETWIRNKNTNLLAQLRDGCDLALARGDEFMVLLDDDITYLTLIEETEESYRIKSKKNVRNGDWQQVLTVEAPALLGPAFVVLGSGFVAVGGREAICMHGYDYD